jgi:hypothetical protein
MTKYGEYPISAQGVAIEVAVMILPDEMRIPRG